MTRVLTAILIFCILNSGCQERATSTRTEVRQMVNAETTYLIVDQRNEKFTALTVVAGARAFTEDKPFRSAQLPNNRLETSDLPEEFVARIAGLLNLEGREPPFDPGGVWFSMATVRAPTGDLEWKYFSNDNASVAKCFGDVRSAAEATGQSVDKLPEWLTNEAMRAVLMP